MACSIWLIGDSQHVVHVEQSAAEVTLQIRDANGLPISLNDTTGTIVHIVPSSIAYFRDVRTPAAG